MIYASQNYSCIKNSRSCRWLFVEANRAHCCNTNLGLQPLLPTVGFLERRTSCRGGLIVSCTASGSSRTCAATHRVQQSADYWFKTASLTLFWWLKSNRTLCMFAEASRSCLTTLSDDPAIHRCDCEEDVIFVNEPLPEARHAWLIEQPTDSCAAYRHNGCRCVWQIKWWQSHWRVPGVCWRSHIRASDGKEVKKWTRNFDTCNIRIT
jgi:hypothetical protein